MSKARSLLLVVDASVARSAGETEHPISSACRRYLLAVQGICHRVAVTDEILAEWKKHQSRFTRKWRVSMAARQKPLTHVQPVSTGLDLQTFTPPHRDAVEKDLCLLEAALSADKVIVTRDDKLQKSLESTPEGDRLRGRYVWHNPLTHGEESLRTL